MGIENFKRWHWAIIGLIAGLAMAYMRTAVVTPDETSTYRRGISSFEFASDLNRPKTSNGYDWLTDITVYPPVENKNYVTAKMLEIQADGQGMYRLVKMDADVPFKVARFSEPKTSSYSIRDYLADIQKKNPDLKFTYAWWAAPAAQYALWTIGGLLVIGGIWPTVVSLMIGAGLGRKKTEEEEYDLDRFGKTPEPAVAAARPAVTAEAHEQLQDYQETLEKNLANAGMQMTADAPVAASASSSGEVKKLTGGPVESATPVGTAEDPKDYAGEYYPVAKPATHKDAHK